MEYDFVEKPIFNGEDPKYSKESQTSENYRLTAVDIAKMELLGRRFTTEEIKNSTV